MGYVDAKQLERLAAAMPDTAYSRYLYDLLKDQA